MDGTDWRSPGFAPPGNGVGKGTKGETSTNYEAGVRFRNNRFSADAIGFYTDFKNTLRQCLFANPCSSPVPGGAPIVDGSTQQTGSKEVYGVEFSGTGDLYRGNSIIVPVRFPIPILMENTLAAPICRQAFVQEMLLNIPLNMLLHFN